MPSTGMHEEGWGGGGMGGRALSGRGRGAVGRGCLQVSLSGWHEVSATMARMQITDGSLKSLSGPVRSNCSVTRFYSTTAACVETMPML